MPRATKQSQNQVIHLNVTNFREINLSNNLINDHLIVHLTKPLSMRGCKIEVLDLSDNDIGDKGGMLLAECLERNIIIRRLNLKNNLIQSEGGKAIRNALFNRNSTNLVMLKLSQNPIDIRLGEEIDDMIFGKYPSLHFIISSSQTTKYKIRKT